MNKHETKKGFTLIELLIVIAIIAILAVAFLPTLLGAPAKGRDTARIASLQTIQKVLVYANLEKGKYPSATGVISATSTSGVYDIAGTNKWDADFNVAFGGTLPTDPTSGKSLYYLKKTDTPGGNYSFGVWAEVEIVTNANAYCGTAAPLITIGTTAVAGKVPCYAILTQ